MPTIDRQQAILDLLKNLRGLDPLKQLFWSQLNYERVNTSLPRRTWTKTTAEALAADPVLFATGGAAGDFHVIYSQLNSPHLPLGDERSVVMQLLKSHPYALFLFSNEAQTQWHFLNVNYDRETAQRRLFRRITIGPQEGLRTASEQLLQIDLAGLGDAAALAIQERHDRAFDVEAVTDKFFKDFRNLFEDTKDALPKTIKSPLARHAFTQRLLNRLLFLCYLQKKLWLRGPNDPHPTGTYLFDLYDYAVAQDDNVYADYLHGLFFNALNRPPSAGSQAERDRLWRTIGWVPFLNGGLFDPTDEWDTQGAVILPNKLFKPILGEDGLLRRYNFTVTEATPLNQEVAVDPEMLGKVFETVVLTSEESDDYQAPNLRKATGSYYTPRTVVTFIVREALKDYVSARVPGLSKDQLAGLLEIDASGELNDEQQTSLKELISQAEAKQIQAQLKAMKACDPAIGSGAFALGLLHELVSLYLLTETVLRNRDPRRGDANLTFNLKKQVIEHNLYGVDLQGKAVEICKLRLWLSLTVDYQVVDFDLATCDQDRFEEAIQHIPSLPNLTYKIRRGDALLDLVHGRPFRMKEISHSAQLQAVRDQLEHVHREFFLQDDADKKRQLRLKALQYRTQLTRLQVEYQREELRATRGTQIDMFGSRQSKAAQQQFDAELDSLNAVLDEVKQVEAELERLNRRARLKPADDEVLTKLEDAGEDHGITFTWELDFPEVFAHNSPLPAGRGAGGEGRGGFDVIVGNPPFVTARNPEKRELYRERWKETSHLKFQLVAPFFQRAFGLLRPNGHLGFIVSNAFAKREFGKPLVEDFFPKVEVQKIVDCSGLMFPGHGTPTCIIFGRNRTPAPDSMTRIAATLPGGGDLKTPPERSPLWASLQLHHDQANYTDERIMVADRTRTDMAKWPWNLDASTEITRKLLESRSNKLEELLGDDIGVCTMTNADDVFIMADDQARRLHLPTTMLRIFQQGDTVRDWALYSDEKILVPYDASTVILDESKLGQSVLKYLEPYHDILANRLSFGNRTFEQLGRNWYAFERMNANKYRTSQFITFGEIATHQHFVYWSQPRVFERDSPVIKLPETSSSDDHHFLAGLLNSSAALFWLKLVCFNKGAGDEEERDRFVYAGGKVQQLPVPSAVLQASALRERLTALSRACWERGQQLPGLALKRLFDQEGEAYWEWYKDLAGFHKSGEKERLEGGNLPGLTSARAFRTGDELLQQREAFLKERERLHQEMIALQEDMDWLVYAAYGLLPLDHPAVGVDPRVDPLGEHIGSPRPLALGERPFELLRDGKPIPDHFSAERRVVWQARLKAIQENEHIRRIEQPVYKRRWYRKESVEHEFERAFEWWLLEKAEWWLEKKARGGPVSLDRWAAAMWEDERMRAAVQAFAPEAVAEVKPGSFIKLFKSIVTEATVPDWIPAAMDWEQVEKKFKAKGKVPARAKRIRGKLNVPRERFRINDEGEYVWAGKKS